MLRLAIDDGSSGVERVYERVLDPPSRPRLPALGPAAVGVEPPRDGGIAQPVEREPRLRIDDRFSLGIELVATDDLTVLNLIHKPVAIRDGAAEAVAAFELGALAAADVAGKVLAVLIGHLARHADERLVGDVGVVLDRAQGDAVAAEVVEDLAERAGRAHLAAAAHQPAAVEDPQLGSAVFGRGALGGGYGGLEPGPAAAAIARHVLLAERLATRRTAANACHPLAHLLDLRGDAVLGVGRGFAA